MSALRLELNSSQRYLAAFEDEMASLHVPVLYRAALLIVAFAMILLPLIYISFIAGVGYAVYFHAVYNTNILSGSSHGLWRLVAYLTPIVVGGILVLFMIKPLFTPVPKPAQLYSLERGKEPLLFDFVAKICQLVKAPKPHAININCDVNAYASFARGLRSFWSNELNLTIGLPLVYGMQLNQLAGIFAHEFGHFAQGTSMRMTYLIRSINLWLARVVYERDAFDEKLVQWSEEADFRFGIMLHVARLFVWMTRKILWALMMLGHLVSSFMLRQMEHDADRYETHLVGSRTFETTARQLRRLGVAQYGAGVYLNELWKEGRLTDNLPAFVAAKLDLLTPDFAKHDQFNLISAKTGFFDTHPSDHDRIEHARREHAKGIFHLDLPATALFQNLDEVSQAATCAHYKQLLGAAFSSISLISNAEFMRRQNTIDQDQAALSRYFQNLLSFTRLLIVPTSHAQPIANMLETIESLKQARARMLVLLPQASEVFKGFVEKEAQKLQALEAAVCSALAIKNPKNVAASKSGSIRSTTVQTSDESETALLQFESEVLTRLASALRLISLPEFTTTLAAAQVMHQEISNLLPVLEKFNEIRDDLLLLRKEFVKMTVVAKNADAIANDRDHAQIISRMVSSAHNLLHKIIDKLSKIDYPFEHTKGRISLAQYASANLPAGPDFQLTFLGCQELGDNLFSLYFRIMGRLAAMAERVEATAGLEPLPAPAPPEQTISAT